MVSKTAVKFSGTLEEFKVSFDLLFFEQAILKNTANIKINLMLNDYMLILLGFVCMPTLIIKLVFRADFIV